MSLETLSSEVIFRRLSSPRVSLLPPAGRITLKYNFRQTEMEIQLSWVIVNNSTSPNANKPQSSS